MMLYVCNDSIGHPFDINAVIILKFRDVYTMCEHICMSLLLRPCRRMVVEPWQLQEKPWWCHCEGMYGALRAPLIDKLLYLKCWMLKVKGERDASLGPYWRGVDNIPRSLLACFPAAWDRRGKQARLQKIDDFCHIMLPLRVRPPQKSEPHQTRCRVGLL